MKIKHLIIIFILLPILASCGNGRQEAMLEYVRTFLHQYPEATLQDIYKGSFQDVFGPAHILTDREAVKRYILRELETATRLEGEDYEPCGWQRNFYRVNLSVVKDGRISADELADALMRSAEGIDLTVTQAWKDEWQEIQQAARTVCPQLQGFSEDSARIAVLLNEGKYVMHHSEAFNVHYQPHYRIIRKDVFEEKILPKL